MVLREKLHRLEVSPELVEDLLFYHTPTQIEIGLKQLQGRDYTGDQIAQVILRGRFGYRKGFKEKLAKPKGAAPPQRGQGGEGSQPYPNLEEQKQLLQAFLDNGTIPSPTSPKSSDDS